MPFKEAYVPENETEKRLMEDLHTATRRAHRDGLSKADISKITSFMASATLSDLERQKPAQDEDSGSERDSVSCPECGTEIESYVAGMGLNPLVLKPCGCELTEDDMTAENGMDLRTFYENLKESDGVDSV